MTDFQDLDSTWSWVVMVAVFMALFVIGGTNYTVGLVHSILLEKYHESQTTTAWVGAVHTSVSNLAAPLSSLLIDHFSVRVAMMTGGILYTIGFLSTAFVPNIIVAVLTFGVIAGLGGAAGWTACMIAPNFHFKKYKNIAQGISFSGIGAGMFGVPPVISWVKDHYGSYGFFIALACVSAQFIVCGMLARPSSLENHSRHVRQTDKTRRGKHTSILYPFLKILTTRSVLFYTLSMFAYGFGMYIVFVFLPIYCIRQGSSEMQASYVLSICGISSIFGRVLAGLIANFNRINEVFLYVGSLVILAIISVLIPFYTASFTGQIIYAILFGLFFGCPYVTITPINFSFVGVGLISSALGVELCGCGAGGIIGPILGGLLADSGSSLSNVFILAGISIGLSAALGFIPYLLHRNDTSTANRTTSDDWKELDVQTETVKEKMFRTEDDVEDQKDRHESVEDTLF